MSTYNLIALTLMSIVVKISLSMATTEALPLRDVFDKSSLEYNKDIHSGLKQYEPIAFVCELCMAKIDIPACWKCWKSQSLNVISIKYDAKPVNTPSSADKRRSGFERSERNDGCGCCFLTRLSNTECCRVCYLLSKHRTKRTINIS